MSGSLRHNNSAALIGRRNGGLLLGKLAEEKIQVSSRLRTSIISSQRDPQHEHQCTQYVTVAQRGEAKVLLLDLAVFLDHRPQLGNNRLLRQARRWGFV